MKTILKKWQMLLMLVLTLGITACSDDNGGNGDNGDDDGDNLSDILFENGTQLGNGADDGCKLLHRLHGGGFPAVAGGRLPSARGEG